MAIDPNIEKISKNDISEKRDLVQVFDVSEQTTKLALVDAIGGGAGLGIKGELPLDGTLRVIVDSEGTDSPLQLSTDEVGISKDSTATTQDTAVIKSTDTNAGIAIVPNGTGAITAQVPDGTTAGGNARGAYTVDLQRVRNNIDQVAKRDYSVITGGQNNWCDGDDGRWGFVGGGLSNRQRTAYGAIVGGQSNQTGDGNSGNVADFIGGGRQNIVFGSYSAIVAGRQNSSNGSYTSIGGGYQNTIANSYATVVGGSGNTSSGQYSVSGGVSSTASGKGSIAIGTNDPGAGCVASGIGSVAFGGRTQVQGNYSMTVGDTSLTNTGTNSLLFGQSQTNTGSYNATFGRFNTNSQNYTLAFGQGTIAAYRGALSFQSSTATTSPIDRGIAQSHQLTMQKTADLISGGTTELFIDGVSSKLIPRADDIVWNVTVKTVAVVTAVNGAAGIAVGDTFMENKSLLFKRIAGTSSVVNLATDNTFADGGMGGSGMTYTAGASQELALTFSAPTFGAGDITVRVVSKVELVEVAY